MFSCIGLVSVDLLVSWKCLDWEVDFNVENR